MRFAGASRARREVKAENFEKQNAAFFKDRETVVEASES